ncbi:MAG TPA: alpha/beta hydrolase [Blastocatellia bacterium]|nr:alpha/beta hydrolase [Blastocatellia bacterium]
MKLIFRCCLIVFLMTCALSVSQTQQAAESKPEDRFAKLDSMKVHYQNYGKGDEALIFIHGWTCNLTFWKANIPAFTDQTRVIAIDLPGHGQSEKPELAYTMKLYAQAVEAVMRDAKVAKGTLVGHSMGAPVLWQFYRNFPEKTRALVIVDGGLKAMGTRESMKPFLDPLRLPAYRANAERNVEYLTQGMKDPKVRTEVKTAMVNSPQHTMVSAFEGMLDPTIWPVKGDKITVPTLALMANNGNWNSDYEKYIRELVPGLEYQVWSGVSHFLMMDEPQKFNDTVLAFLKKNNLLKK